MNFGYLLLKIYMIARNSMQKKLQDSKRTIFNVKTIGDVRSARRQLAVIFGTSGRRVAPDRNLMFIRRTLEDVYMDTVKIYYYVDRFVVHLR